MSLALLPAWARTERLAVKAFTAAEGLAHDRIHHIVQDRVGFLWLSTADGLSRFDGEHFKTYGVMDGLPYASVNQVLETSPGVYWVATNGGGVCRFDAAETGTDPRRRLRVYAVGHEPRTNRVNALHRDRAGRIWAGTDGGLFQLAEQDRGEGFLAAPLGQPQPDRRVGVWALAEDAAGSLWMGTTFGLARRVPEGRVVTRPVSPTDGADRVSALLPESDGRLWVGHQTGLFVVGADGAAPRRVGVHGEHVVALLAAGGGGLWIGTSAGLTRFDGSRFHRLTAANEFVPPRVRALAADRDGNVWAGTDAGGAMRITSGGFSSFGEADGLQAPEVISLFESRSGDLYAEGVSGLLHRFDGERFHAVAAPAAPRPGAAGPSAERLPILQDRAGEWWVATAAALLRYGAAPRLEDLRGTPRAAYTQRDGLPAERLGSLYEDSRGDLWASVARQPLVLRLERTAGRLHRYAVAEGVDAPAVPGSFCEDRAGNVWCGLEDGGLARHRAGRFHRLGPADGLATGQFTRALMVDRAGRLWVAVAGAGLGRIDDPAAERPRMVFHTSAQGLSSLGVKTLAEDRQGRIYVGGARGVDRLDPVSGQVRHYTTADGLAGNEQMAALRDRQGALWFGSLRGLSRLMPPAAEVPAREVRVRIGAVRIGGVALPMSELGQEDVQGPELEAGRTPIEIDFFGVELRAAQPLRYRHRLEGLEKEWTASGRLHTVRYAGLPAGRYRFEVEAESGSGASSPSRASVSFAILPPLWRRWWFVTATALLALLGLRSAERYRVARLLELERVRTRIATDLHDDVGSSLSQIAILSEVARRRLGADGAPAREALASIAATSREMVDAMGDIVWAVSPRNDHLSDLTHRMRRFASDVLTARGIALRFHAPGDELGASIGPELRRQVYLIFKESVNNLVKHSGCARAEIEIRVDDGALLVEVGDDGRGIDEGREHEGLGSTTLRARAARLGGELQVRSEPGRGTRVSLRVPLGPHAFRW